MTGITGMGTTFDLPNYAGELFALTPADTPLLSAVGGLTGGGMTSGIEFEWQTYDLRDPSQRTRVEGATAPTAEERVRANVRNVVQIHQEKVSVSYTKQATFGQLATPSAAPYRGVDGANPVTNELDWQVAQALKSIALDVNYSFINGSYANPTTNATARKTRGLLTAISTNRIAKGTSVTGASSATDTVTSTGHGLADGAEIVFTNTSTATGIVAGRVYFVDAIDTNTFKVSTSTGGSPITLGTASGLVYTVPWSTTLTGDHVSDLLQLAYDNGGISEQETATLIVNSRQKRALTHAYADAYGKFQETSRNVGGVAVNTIVTDFGTLNVMLDRHMPQDTIAAVSLEQLMPVFLNVPGKGVMFEEPLAKTGASDEVQIYGEVGLKYGNERAHAVMTGLAV
ncbi:SU10 major capsid protein [Streptomyces anthocyanicus]|uniref:SU10 major capsid protein n=1 Tax=Streptomyces anthocyanicus TaxID=68174 RepID=UPI003815FEAF